MKKIDERTMMRRYDRALVDDESIEALLARAEIGHTATAVENQPYLIPHLFWFDAGRRRIYFHGAQQGRTRSNLEQNPNVTFCVSEVGRFLPAKQARKRSLLPTRGRDHSLQTYEPTDPRFSGHDVFHNSA